MKSEASRGTFLIVSMRTGAMDGFYFGRQIAQEALDGLREDYPAGDWVLTEIVDAPTDVSLPDALFWARRPEFAD